MFFHPVAFYLYPQQTQLLYDPLKSATSRICNRQPVGSSEKIPQRMSKEVAHTLRVNENNITVYYTSNFIAWYTHGVLQKISNVLLIVYLMNMVYQRLQ